MTIAPSLIENAALRLNEEYTGLMLSGMGQTHIKKIGKDAYAFMPEGSLLVQMASDALTAAIGPCVVDLNDLKAEMAEEDHWCELYRTGMVENHDGVPNSIYAAAKAYMALFEDGGCDDN